MFFSRYKKQYIGNSLFSYQSKSDVSENIVKFNFNKMSKKKKSRRVNKLSTEQINMLSKVKGEFWWVKI